MDDTVRNTNKQAAEQLARVDHQECPPTSAAGYENRVKKTV